MFNSSAKFEIKAIASCAALTPINLAKELDLIWNYTPNHERTTLDPG